MKLKDFIKLLSRQDQEKEIKVISTSCDDQDPHLFFKDDVDYYIITDEYTSQEYEFDDTEILQ